MNRLLILLSAVTTISTSFFAPNSVKTDKKEVFNASVNLTKTKKSVVVSEKADPAADLYSALDFSGINKLNPEVFIKALKGFENLKKAGKLNAAAHILSVCDFSLSSNVKRLWVIDLDTKKVLFNSLVAHGKNTGEEFATNFSNTESSLQSSMGFYITHETYTGENGYSLKLEGMDRGFNDAAMQRAIVMHGADYVSEEFALEHKRIGRSWGCPAVPRALAEPIINTVKNESCLFIFYPDNNYLQSSEWLKS